MLALGIPGSPTAPVLLGGLLIWGLQPGPLLFVEQKDFVWGLIASMYLGNVVGLIVVLSTVPLFASILRIPFSIIAPVIIVICAIGCLHGAQRDARHLVHARLRRHRLPLQEARLSARAAGAGAGAGRQGEDSFRQAMLVSQGDLMIMWSNPLVGSITTLALILLFWPLISKLLALIKPAEARRVSRRTPVD
jgi:putative tricarboxylic transport membrane protein